MNIEAATRQWLMNQVIHDKTYVDNLVATYGTTILGLWRHFQRNSTMSTDVLAIPNEVLDFIDGNGFLIRYVGNNVNITIVPKRGE